MSETTASDAPEEVEKVKPAHSEKGVCKHWAQKGFCFYGADTVKGFVASIGKIKDLAKTLGCRPIKNKAHAAIADIVIDALMKVSKKKLTEKKPMALLDICYRAKGNGAPGKLVLKGVKHPK